MESKTNDESVNEEIWEKHDISGGFREPGGRVARPIKIEEMPLEIQERAREVLKRYDKEEKHPKFQ